MSMSRNVCMKEGTHRAQKGMWNLMDLELQEALSSLMQVQEPILSLLATKPSLQCQNTYFQAPAIQTISTILNSGQEPHVGLLVKAFHVTKTHSHRGHPIRISHLGKPTLVLYYSWLWLTLAPLDGLSGCLETPSVFWECE